MKLGTLMWCSSSRRRLQTRSIPQRRRRLRTGHAPPCHRLAEGCGRRPVGGDVQLGGLSHLGPGSRPSCTGSATASMLICGPALPHGRRTVQLEQALAAAERHWRCSQPERGPQGSALSGTTDETAFTLTTHRALVQSVAVGALACAVRDDVTKVRAPYDLSRRSQYIRSTDYSILYHATGDLVTCRRCRRGDTGLRQ